MSKEKNSDPRLPALIIALEDIDAAVFSGDVFLDKANRELFLGYVKSWIREMGSIDCAPGEVM